MKKIINLSIYFDEDKKTFNAQLKHRCDLETAYEVIQDYINRKRGKKDA